MVHYTDIIDDLSYIDVLVQHIQDIKIWISYSPLRRNPCWTEIVIFGAKAQRGQLCVPLQSLARHTEDQVKNLWVNFDCDVSFEAHFRNATSVSFCHH